MRYRKLGGTDIDVSVVALGSWAIGGLWWGGTDEKKSIEAIKESMDNGVNFIDTAPAYGKGLSEKIVGKAIKGSRDQVVIATKCGLLWDSKEGKYFLDYEGSSYHRYLGPDSIKKELEDSLKRLGTDYIDLYITHWQDITTPISETMEALVALKEQGKIRAIGASNASVDDLKAYSKTGFVDADQEKYNLLDNGMEGTNIKWCRKNGATFLAYSPIAQGLLTGRLSPDRQFEQGDLRKDNPSFSKEKIATINGILKEYFGPLSEKHDCTVAQIAIAALTSQEAIVALCGARNKQQAKENSAAGAIKLNQKEIKLLKKALHSVK